MTKKPVVFDIFNESFYSNKICEALDYTLGKSIIHEFPDEEILVKIDTPVKDKTVIIIASLNKPNNKVVPLVFMANTLKDLGASKIILIAPYLAYMRQDKQFHENEGVTSKYFANLLSTYFDQIIAIDPHLHRCRSLDKIFSIPTILLHATHSIADWIINHIEKPLLIGPDKESKQWIEEIAAITKAPYLITEKIRTSDTTVSTTIPQFELYPYHTPVIIDDIISTGMTMIETIRHIQSKEIQSIYCIGIHAIFAKNAYQALLQMGVKNIITCNTVKHATNKIDLSYLIIQALK